MFANGSDSSATGDAKPVPLSPALAQPPQPTDGAAALVDLQPPPIGEHSQVDYSAEKSNGDANKITKSTTVEMSTFQMENSVETSNGDIVARKIEQSAEMEEKLRRERDERIARETIDFLRRLDPTGMVTLMCLASPLYAVLAALPLWLVADKPVALLWTFAHLACFYMFLWIITLSTIRISTVFFHITYIFLLSCTVVHLIGIVNGMVVLYTEMIYVAGMLGYGVAEHLHRGGFEQTASALCSTPFNSKDLEEKASLIRFTTVLMTTPILARMAWVFLVPYSGHMTPMDLIEVVVELTAEIFAVAALWIVYIIDFKLRGALVSMERFGATAIICWIACYSLALFLSFRIDEAVGMLVMWLGWMAIGGFFGYCLGVRACYCKMLTGSDNTAAAKEQNGGKTLAGMTVTRTMGFTLRKASARSKTRRRTKPVARAAETTVCGGLGIIKDGEDVTELAMAEFARRFHGQVDGEVLKAMRMLFQVNTPEDDAFDNALLAHGCAAGLDHEEEDAGTATADV